VGISVTRYYLLYSHLDFRQYQHNIIIYAQEKKIHNYETAAVYVYPDIRSQYNNWWLYIIV